MCGIVGYVSSRKHKKDISNMLELIKHRGPDGNGIFEDITDCSNVVLGHTRLSIIDLNAVADQPFVSQCENYIMVYNGELYNYKELKEKYLSEIEFKTHSDTEVLFELYIKYGRRILNELEGMFAFSIYNKRDNTLFIVRDQLGIKPVYYFHDDQEFIFSSEIKSIFGLGVNKEIDNYAMYEFMLNSFVYEPHTGFKHIYKLKAGEFILYDTKKKQILEQNIYWNPQNNKLNKRYSINLDDMNRIDKEIIKSIKQHTISDVPVCLFFSGGVDSSLILSELGNTIAIVVKSDLEDMKEAGFENDFDYSKKIAKYFNKEIKEISIDAIKDKSNFLSSIEQASVISEELIADLTFIPTLNISNKARKLGYKVALSGMGADELFAGYGKYRLVQYRKLFCTVQPIIKLFAKLPYLSKKIERFQGFCKETELVWQYTSILGYFKREDIAQNYKYFNDQYEKKYFQKLSNIFNMVNGTAIKKILYLDLFGFLSHNFLVSDKASMLASLEIRVPLATKKLFEIAFNTNIKDMLSFRSTKIPLRQMLYKKLPKKLVDREKTGFHPPMDNIINRFDEVELINIFEENNLFDLIDKNYISQIVSEHINKVKNHTLKIFQLLYLGYWYNNNFKD